MADAPKAGSRALDQMSKEDRDLFVKALLDGLTGRKALLRAYETVQDRVADPETKAALQRFADEERAEYAVAESIVRQHGGDPNIIQNIKSEVVAFLGRGAFLGPKGPYSDARDLAMLYGIEATGKVGAEFTKRVAERVGDSMWTEAAEKSLTRAGEHMSFLQERVLALEDRLPIMGGGPTRI